MKAPAFLFLSVTLLLSSSHAQIFTLRGIVRDVSTGEALGFAHIAADSSTQGSTADEHGKFTLNVAQGDHVLRCSYVGYKTESVRFTVKGTMDVVIALHAIDILLQDVTVYAHQANGGMNQAEVSALTLESETIGQMTSMMPDVLRSIQMLPGVSSDNEMSAKFNVRGGNEDENLILINGTQVYEPYHIKEAPNASIGIFDVDMIRKMDLISGGFTARYGDRMSSVVNIEYREGDKERLRGQASLSLTDLDALLEGPIGDRGSFIIGARQSYLQYVLKLLDFAPTIHPSFYDVQGVLSYALAPQHTLALKFIHAGDRFAQDPTGSLEGAFWYPYVASGNVGYLTQSWHDSSEQHAQYYSSMAALQSVDILSSQALVKTEVSYYDERQSTRSWWTHEYADVFRSGGINAFYRNAIDRLNQDELSIRTLEFNSSLDLALSSAFSIKIGGSYQRIQYDREYVSSRTIEEVTNQYNYPDTAVSLRNENADNNSLDTVHAGSHKLAGYLENIVLLGDQIILNVGGRFDYFGLNRDLTWSPRVNLAYRVAPELTVRAAWGHYYQSPIPQQLAYSTASDSNTQSQRAIHFLLGAQLDLAAGEHGLVTVKLEGYRKIYKNLISSTVASSGEIIYSHHNDAIGRTIGLDACVMFTAPPVSGWVSYSLVKAEQNIINDNLGYVPRNTDQRHTISAIVTVDAGKNWDLSTRFVYGSGYPFTPSVAVFDPIARTWAWQTGPLNSAYLPYYERIDVRVSKQFRVFGLHASAYADISNLFNFVNILSYSYEFDNQGNPVVKAVNLWPILPTLGLSVGF